MIQLLFVILLFLIQEILVPYITIQSIAPDLLLLFVAGRGFSQRRSFSTATGFATGLVQDLLSLHPLGCFTLSKSVAGFLFSTFSGSSKDLSIPLKMISLLLIGLLHQALFYLLQGMTDPQKIMLFFSHGMLSLLYTLIPGMPFFLLMDRVEQDRRRKRS